MEQRFDKFLMFRNRLYKVYRHLSKIARKAGVTCYRIYDHDLPEAPFIIEVYENLLYVSEYKRAHTLSEEAYTVWLRECIKIMSEITGISEEHIYIKMRSRKEGKQGQYQKWNDQKEEHIVGESGLKFLVNLSDYLDTGLFLDHRITRQMVKEESAGKRVLNLFCYTGSFSVYAAAGSAASVTSVDLSKTYLSWAEKNMQQNIPMYTNHYIVHADVIQYLKMIEPCSFDLIVMDPPTFSNSKRMDDVLDIKRDHVMLINDCMDALSADGVLYFSTNYRKFKLEVQGINAKGIKDITKATTPFDFTGKLHRQCFKICK